jgi:prevent-host-death family protein
MNITNIHQAKSQLSKLIEQAENGEEVIIGRAGKPVARLVAYGPVSKGRRKGGQWKETLWIADDFESLPDDIAAAFGLIEEK